MNATHQFALIHVSKKLSITRIKMNPPVTLPKSALINQLLPKLCPQYEKWERVAAHPQNTHCITGIVVYKGVEQNAVLSWRSKPVEQVEAADFYTGLTLASLIGAVKSDKARQKFFKTALAV